MAAPDGAASFSVDLARAPQAIADLKDARQQLQDIRADAYRLQTVVPPGHDQVSYDAAYVLGQAANGRPGSLVEALTAGITRLDSLIANLQSELQTYSDTESNNVKALGGET